MQTRPSTRRFLTALAALACLCVTATVAHAQTTVITSLPYTINSSGLYILNSSLNSSVTTGSLITINASNVTIDFQDHYIAGAVNNTSQTTVGISANEQSNITIKNGTIAFCYQGIYLNGNGSATTNAVGARILNMRITYCYYEGVRMSAQPSSLVDGCQFSQIGFSTATFAAGLNLFSPGVTVQNCQISNVVTAAASSGYAIDSTTGCFSKNNKISTAKYGIIGGIYQDNLAYNCTTPFSPGVDGGGNTSQ